MIFGAFRRVVAFLKEEQNRNLMSWLAATAIGGGSLIAATYKHFAPEDVLEFAQIKGTLTTYNFNNSVSPNFEQDREKEICGFTEDGWFSVSDPALCQSASYVFIGDLFAPEHGFDITILNKSNQTIVVSDVSFLVDYAEQSFTQCGADTVEAVPVHFDVDAIHKGLLSATFEVVDCNVDVLAGLGIDGFSSKGDKACTILGIFDPSYQFSSDDNVWIHSRLSTPEIDAYCKETDCQSASLGDIFNFKLHDPINFRAILNDPIKVPGGEPFRFKLRLNSYDHFPNNIAGRLMINGSDYMSELIYIMTPDSCQRWILGG
nr:hypothetical protein [uncultured Cohaesibacter sp.]